MEIRSRSDGFVVLGDWGLGIGIDLVIPYIDAFDSVRIIADKFHPRFCQAGRYSMSRYKIQLLLFVSIQNEMNLHVLLSPLISEAQHPRVMNRASID